MSDVLKDIEEDNSKIIEYMGNLVRIFEKTLKDTDVVASSDANKEYIKSAHQALLVYKDTIFTMRMAMKEVNGEANKIRASSLNIDKVIKKELKNRAKSLEEDAL